MRALAPIKILKVCRSIDICWNFIVLNESFDMIVIPSPQSKPATAKVSLSKFKDIGVAPGSWVEIYANSLEVNSRSLV